jgi:hypothetical protein
MLSLAQTGNKAFLFKKLRLQTHTPEHLFLEKLAIFTTALAAQYGLN